MICCQTDHGDDIPHPQRPGGIGQPDGAGHGGRVQRLSPPDGEGNAGSQVVGHAEAARHQQPGGLALSRPQLGPR